MGFFSGTVGSLGSVATQVFGKNPAYQIGGVSNAINSFLKNGDILGAVGIARELGVGEDKWEILGGISPNRAKQLHKEMMAIKWERKNLFFVEILDISPMPDFLSKLPPKLRAQAMDGASYLQKALGKANSMTGGLVDALTSNAMGLLTGAAKFNIYAIDLEYTPITNNGDVFGSGGAVFDLPTGTEHVEISMTMHDDVHGTIKKWLSGKSSQFARADGSFGVLQDYALNVRVLHAFMGDEVALGRGHSESFMCRVASVGISKSRSDSGLSELQVRLIQIDTTR